MDRLKIYIRSYEVPTIGFIDKEGAMHECGAAQAHANAFQGLAQHGGLFGKRCLSDEDYEVLTRIDSFCRDNATEYEVVDIGTINFLRRLRLRMKGRHKTPAICMGSKTLYGVPSGEDLKNLLNGAR